jgi:hypothetical protein
MSRLPGSNEWIPVDEPPEGMELAEEEIPGVVSDAVAGCGGFSALTTLQLA